MSSMPCADPQQAYNGHDCVSNHGYKTVFYFITTVGAIVVLGAAAILVFFCMFMKRRRVQNQMRLGHQSMLPPLGFAPRGDIMMDEFATYPPPVGETGPPPGTESVATAPQVPKNVEDGGSFHCVIMAGEERPTFIAHQVTPADTIGDARSDRTKVADGDVEKGNNIPKNQNR